MAQINKLTALQIKGAKAKEKEYSLNDGRDLYVRVYPNGTKSFYLQQIISGKRIKQNLGLVGDISLESVRKLAEAKIAKTKKIPAEYRLNKITFKTAISEYLEYQTAHWNEQRFHLFNLAYNKFFAKLDNLPLIEIRRKDILNLHDPVIRQNHRKYFGALKTFLSVFWGWAVQNEYCEHNIIKDIEIKYLFAKTEVKHHPHLNSINEVIKLKDDIVNSNAELGIKILALFQLYTAVRPSEARLATWDEIDLESGIWRIPASRMKMRKIHEVPLSKEILKMLKEISAENGLCFKSAKADAYHKSSVSAMLYKIGYKDKINAHGFRATFATIANELKSEHGFNNEIIQSCLAHQTQNQVASAYNHAEYKDARAKLLA